jgi:hypothetical protein
VPIVDEILMMGVIDGVVSSRVDVMTGTQDSHAHNLYCILYCSFLFLLFCYRLLYDSLLGVIGHLLVYPCEPVKGELERLVRTGPSAGSDGYQLPGANHNSTVPYMRSR